MNHVSSYVVVGRCRCDWIGVEVKVENLVWIYIDPISSNDKIVIIEAIGWNIQLSTNLLAIFSINKANIKVINMSCFKNCLVDPDDVKADIS